MSLWLWFRLESVPGRSLLLGRQTTKKDESETVLLMEVLLLPGCACLLVVVAANDWTMEGDDEDNGRSTLVVTVPFHSFFIVGDGDGDGILYTLNKKRKDPR